MDHGDGQKHAAGGQPSYGALADTTKQEERKLNLCLTSFEAKEGEIEKEFV